MQEKAGEVDEINVPHAATRTTAVAGSDCGNAC
jgi:hypothetical protein